MSKLGWLLVALGLALQLLVPAGVFGTSTVLIAGFPLAVFSIFASVALISVGYIVQHLRTTAADAAYLDASVEEEGSP